MSKMPWFRAYTEMIDDEKLRLLAFEDRWHFVAIMCLKGQGVLDANDPLMMRKAAVKIGVDLRTLEEIARRLAEVGLIDKDTLQPLQWESRQMRSDADTTAAERKRRQRERAKGRAQVTENAADTQGHSDVTDASRVTGVTVTRTEEDIDTDKEEKITTTARARSAAPAARAHTAADLVALGVDEDVATEFLANRKRKRAALTPLALAGIQREAAKAGWTLNDALRKAVERGWQSVEAAWLMRDSAGAQRGQPGPSLYDKNTAAAQRAKQMLFGDGNAAI